MCLVCAACAVLALPAGAGAKPGYYVSKPGLFVSISLRGSNGYLINVVGFNSKHVALLASKGGMAVSYLARGRVTDDSVEADFGNRGRVSLRMQPGGPPEDVGSLPGCKGKQNTLQKVRFVGSIRFRGENGFTQVSAKGAHGTVSRSYRQVCKRGTERHHYTRPPASSLSAFSSNQRLPWFSVFKEEPETRHDLFLSEEANYMASQSERREGVWINRLASASAPPKTFTVSPPGAIPFTGTVTPPAPFAGSATYERGPNGASAWSGDLTVELPGLGRMPLTGPPYAARLCRSFGCACPPHEQCFFVIAVSGRPNTRWLQRKIARLR